jgi:hypothetical protein
MASFDLSWTPAGGLNSTAQQVQYKAATSSTWIPVASLSATANSYTLPGLADNTIYDFSIVNICTFGGPTAGVSFQTISIVCPTVTTTPSYNSVSFNFDSLGGSVTEYRVDLMNGAGNSTIAFKTITSSSGTVADSFTGLDFSTNYNLRITPKAGTYTKQCPLVPFATAALPTCSAPTSLTVEIDDGLGS